MSRDVLTSLKIYSFVEETVLRTDSNDKQSGWTDDECYSSLCKTWQTSLNYEFFYAEQGFEFLFRKLSHL